MIKIFITLTKGIQLLHMQMIIFLIQLYLYLIIFTLITTYFALNLTFFPIHCSGNQINSIEGKSFECQPNLEELHLANNELSGLHPDTFVGLHNLTVPHTPGFFCNSYWYWRSLKRPWIRLLSRIGSILVQSMVGESRLAESDS